MTRSGVIEMIVLPYKVNLNLEGISVPDHFRCTEKLALAYDSRNAMHNVLSIFCGIRAKSERDRLIQSGRVKCVRLYPYWVFDEREREGGVFAKSASEARHTEGFKDPSARPCDPWYVLNGLSDTELADQCLLVWAYRNEDSKKSDLAWFVYPVWARKRKFGYGSHQWKEPYTDAHRSLMIAQLRLAMMLPFIPSRRVNGRTDDLRKEEFAEETRRVEACARFKALHKDNVGIRLVDDLLAKVGPELNFEIEGCVKRFCQAYGYNAHFMRWAEIQALWTEGVPGLETSRIKGSLGIK